LLSQFYKVPESCKCLRLQSGVKTPHSKLVAAKPKFGVRRFNAALGQIAKMKA
jgi:hypothetical protein